ncbi:MAG: hypothetical protein ABF289_02240 [Clostridiales bacterium]
MNKKVYNRDRRIDSGKIYISDKKVILDKYLIEGLLECIDVVVNVENRTAKFNGN